jgi:molybdopterin-guanine dinucleotide biosynthesis protein A
VKQVTGKEIEKLTTKEVSGIILAGGRSSRMGKNKAFLTVDNNQKIIEGIIELFQELFQETIIVSNEPELYEYLGVPVTTDIIPRQGPLSGIHAGLVKAGTQYSFVVPCDMPFLQANLIKLLVEEAVGFDVAVPQIGKYLQPLHAVYSKNCLEHIEKCLNNNIVKVFALYPWVKVNFVGESKLSSAINNGSLDQVFFNINTQEELEQAKQFNR